MMEDQQIIDLYWNRDESAITQTNDKYAAYCRYIASGIVADPEDTEECLNDAYLALWNTIPPRKPNNLTTYLGKIVRNVSLNRWKRSTAQKRKSTQVPLTLEELSECIPASNGEEQVLDRMALVASLNSFLEGLTQEHRRIFMARYWYLRPVKDIAEEYGITESKVKMSLMRSRAKLRQELEKEGVTV